VIAVSETGASLRAELISEIADRGPIPFARFMEICLYHPRHGYYTRGLGGGGGRDYLTSSGLHRAYGALVARQAEDMWRGCGRPDPFFFVEFGPGEGLFAVDFLAEAERHGAFARCLRYVLVEVSPVLAARQRARIQGRTSLAVEWATEADLETRRGFVGVLFANEVIDAFPVHRVVGTPEGPREIHVAADGEALREVLLPLSNPAVGRFLETAGAGPADGQEVDLNLAAPCWLAWALSCLRRGYVLLVDYGHEARELYDPARRRGTLLAYHRHRTSEEFLERPGDQDLTAHVDFTALRRTAEESGARVLGLTTQARFLIALGALEFLEDGPAGGATGGDPGAAIDRLREREALKEIILPGRMGEKFRVLLIGVGEVGRDLRGLDEPWARACDPGAAAGAGGRAGRAGAAGTVKD
jgi:SAM-dependent MidA family methyltransferase